MASNDHGNAGVILPVCRWRGRHTNGNYTCASPKVMCNPNGFIAENVCINRSGQPCFAADHEPLTADELKARADRAQTVPMAGAGTELRAMLSEINAGDCNCGPRAAQMNLLGIAWCREHRLEIAGWLHEAATKAVKEFPVTDPVEAFLPLVDEAIRRAELAETSRKS